ncbi:HutP family protein [Desulfosporosinus sp. FKB]|uniref:HutP family protein n=1 Tax=Desulfosporosinus sp. FKB TaxID=1969835 RepID=UPI00249E4A75|nr:HutP family protein [Desulfosporosinus sp. FKB]
MKLILSILRFSAMIEVGLAYEKKLIELRELIYLESVSRVMMEQCSSLGKAALLIAMAEGDLSDSYIDYAREKGFAVTSGKVGSMDIQKIIAAIETAGRREGLVDERYRSQHALYHAILDALQGLGRGQIQLGNVLRTAGLRFAIVIGPRTLQEKDDLWIAVGLYGMIGAPIKGHEHEVCGLGINHL